MMRYAQENRPDELETSQMTKRLLMANLGFIYQPNFAMSNMILNIVNSDAEYGTISTLREEAASFLSSGDDATIWTQTNISKLVKADSVARETLRLNAVATRSIVRKVMKDGVRTDEGHELPKGTMVSFVSQPMHTDEETFENPNKFDPFRFSRIREATSDPANEESHRFLSTAHLLIFGRGRNSCPGRFLVDFQLKMMVSHLLTNYDIKFPDEYKGQRPPNRWLLEFIFPPRAVKVMVKRRAAV
jgi:cytochrome P450